jgi:hypothetical protein
VPRFPAIAALSLLVAGTALAQQKPPQPRVTGYRVTAEGGVEGTRTVRYDDKGRPLDGRTPETGRPDPAMPERGAAPRSPEPASGEAQPAAPSTARALTTSDGRALPFNVAGSTGPKTVDGSVDADSALRDFGRSNDLLERRFQGDAIELRRDDRFSTSRTLTLGTWGATFSSLGSRRADIALQDTLGAEVRPKEGVEVRSVERRPSPWSRRTTEVEGWDERVGGTAEMAGRQVDENSLAGTLARANTTARSPRSLDQLSMQDINRYQFRRARSTDPGLPVVRPGSGGEVRAGRPD